MSDGGMTAAAERKAVLAASDLVALTKPKQTVLLLATGLGAYLMTVARSPDWLALAVGMASLVAAVSGCTVLNMYFDRDIDSKMARTGSRPLPATSVTPAQALGLGLALSVVGIAGSVFVRPIFGLVVFLGFFFDLVVYTLWLKRRTPLSILFGGISGGMPALAGRALASGGIDLVGVLLAAGVVLWIPAHILTLAMRHEAEYADAGVPVWSLVYGAAATRRLIAFATIAAAAVLFSAGVLEGVRAEALAVLGVLGFALSAFAIAALVSPSDRRNWVLFKAASAYMLGAFACLTIGAVV